MSFEDTIVGLATATGRASVNIIRISGNNAILQARQFFRTTQQKTIKDFESHRVYHGWIENKTKKIDEVLLLVMKAPRSYTREDVVEIHSHGGFAVCNRLLAIFLQNGLRMALAGEFTKRAFLNGRIDLTRAEAIGQIIDAKNLFSLELGIEHLQGKLYQKIIFFKEKITWALSLLNAQIDFIEEQIFFTNLQKIRQELQEVVSQIQEFLLNAERGIKLQEGIKVALMGYSNVGKSSIMNGIMREARSIVTSVAGTTRDVIAESVLINEVSFYFSDTAGIRSTDSIVEKEGILRSWETGKKADIILWVLDASNPNYEIAWHKLPQDILILFVFNKADLRVIPATKIPPKIKKNHYLFISALQATSIEQLEQKIFSLYFQGREVVKEAVFLANQRQKNAAARAQECLKIALRSINAGKTEEIICFELEQALHELGVIVGETTTEELLENIFSNFCIGK